MQMTSSVVPAAAKEKRQQEPFGLVAPWLRAALLLGACGGFVFATILSMSLGFSLQIGSWWSALAQAHGHLQVYGWVGLFVLGVSLHFLPRLRGTPLAAPRFVPWLLGTLVVSLCLRGLSQPLLTLAGAEIWRFLLIMSGVTECVAVLGTIALLGTTFLQGPPLSSRPAFQGTFPLMAVAFCSLGLASIVNLVNVVQASAAAGLIGETGDYLNVTLGLLGFLLPMALAMSVRSLPMYAGLEAFPSSAIRSLSLVYIVGLALMCLSKLLTIAPVWLEGSGMLLVGGVLLLFIGIFLKLMRTRGRLPQKVAQLASRPQQVAQSYKTHVSRERNTYGPFVALVASAYLWAMLGAILLIIEGVGLLLSGSYLFPIDAIRHSLAIGFIALLICGIAPRMIPGFSGGTIASSKLVTATLWLGNGAALLRVGSLLLSPVLVLLGSVGQTTSAIAFGISGPFGLALAICLLINLWPALRRKPTPRIEK